MEFPGIVREEIEVGDDIGVAGQQGSLAVEEMDDKLLVGGIESESGREVDVVVISHGQRWIEEAKR